MTWLEGWERIPGNDAGNWATGARRPKLVLHSTEGGTIEGAAAAYRRNNSWPHVTVDPRLRRRAQHVALNRPARALRNRPSGTEIGRAPIVIQVEIVGYAANMPNLPARDADWLGSEVVGPLCRVAGIPVRSDVTFYGEGAGWVLATPSARQRLSGTAWLEYEGILGHQHVPENDHWDPGAIDIHRIIAAALGPAPIPPPTEDPLMAANLSEDVKREIADIVRAEILKALQQPNERIVRLEKELLEPTGPKGETRADRMARIPDALKALESKIDALAG